VKLTDRREPMTCLQAYNDCFSPERKGRAGWRDWFGPVPAGMLPFGARP
jgi:hypothetical protein